MAITTNVALTTSYAQIAADSVTALTIACLTRDVVCEVALTTANSAPAATIGGLRFVYDDALIREVIGAGYVWARVRPNQQLTAASLAVTA